MPKELTISPVAMIPHKSWIFRAILDLSFGVRLVNGSMVPSANAGTTLEVPAGAIDQLRQPLKRVNHAFAEADPDSKIFMTKFNIKDCFWQMDCQAGQEWNFVYVLPLKEGAPVKLVVPSSLQMGWVESCGLGNGSRYSSAAHRETNGSTCRA